MAGVKEETAPILKCGPCMFDGSTVEPRYFCVDCLEYLCTECIRDHRRNKLLREHKILEEDEIPQDIKLFEEMKKLSYCNKHSYVEIDQYCPSHDVLICTFCLQNDHRLCEGLSDISCVLEDVSRRKNVEQHTHDLRSKCKANDTEMMQTLEDAQNDINKVQKDINDFFHSLKYNIGILEKTLNEKVEHETLRLRTYEQKLSNLEKKASYYANLHTVTSKYGTSKQRIAMNFKVSTLLKEIETDDSAKSVNNNHIQFIQPTKVEDLITMLQQFDLVLTRKDNQDSEFSSDEASLYEDAVECIEPNTEVEATQEEEILATCEMVPKESLRRLQVIGNRISLLKLESQPTEEFKTCVVSVDILYDGRVILLQQENILQLHSQKLSLISKVQLQHKVKDMCVVEQYRNGPFKVAVCFDQSCKIAILKNIREFRQNNEIDCSNRVLNISMYVHHLVALVERDGSKPSYEIQLLDISIGHVCYVFDEFKVFSSINEGFWPVVSLCKPNRISTCKKDMKVIVADEKTIYRFNIKDGECEHNTLYAVGLCVWYYDAERGNINKGKPPELKKSSDVKCDSQGNMYVLTNHGLYQLYSMNYWSNGCCMQRLITCFESASSMTIDVHRNRIIVGYMDADRAHVFEFSVARDK